MILNYNNNHKYLKIYLIKKSKEQESNIRKKKTDQILFN